ncbi:MAG: S9 family peptidase, partial [Bacteroidales bacterium]|nr:S9 family peptidase [Bacteroidales bacterium]
RYRVAAIDLKAGTDLIEIVPEQEDKVISRASIAGGKLVVQFMKDAQDFLSLHDLDGNHIKDLELPGPGAIHSLNTDKDDKYIFYSFESFINPPTVFNYNLETSEMQEYHKTDIDFDDSQYITRQVFYNSKDGTRVPMFIVHHKDVELNGNNPLLLYGYGGFNITKKPDFYYGDIVWLENGGIYVSANIRGGGEYGEEWHEAGMVLNKQNVFDDFIAASEYLIDEAYTSPEKLTIRGGSNGGLLIGAVINQRPDLYSVAFPEVGVMDMLRFNLFTIGWTWVDEYGSSSDSIQFENLYNYSPLHNIQRDIDYPAVMVVTADHDDRVVPAHSFKYIATLQNTYKGKNPVMIRIQTKAGHSAGKPTSMKISEAADKWSFAFYNMKVKPIYID